MTCVWLRKSFPNRHEMLISFDLLQHRENYHRMRWVRFFNSGSNQFSLFRVIFCDFLSEKSQVVKIIRNCHYYHESIQAWEKLEWKFFCALIQVTGTKSRSFCKHTLDSRQRRITHSRYSSSCSRKLERVRTFICFIIYLLADFFVCDLFALFDRCCLERKSTLTR